MATSFPYPLIVDLSHADKDVSFHDLQSVGVVGAILKASEGVGFTDPAFLGFRERALLVFGAGCVHSYHFLHDGNADEQMDHYLGVTSGMPGRWLDIENANPTPSVDTATKSAQILYGKQGSWPGCYGSDGDGLGPMLDNGHFDQCQRWIARYGLLQPRHSCHLWQFQASEDPNAIPIGGKRYDLSAFLGGDADDCRRWMRGIAGV